MLRYLTDEEILNNVKPDFIDGTIKHDSFRFYIKNDLIYYRKIGGGRDRLYIPPLLIYEVFELAYNLRFYSGEKRITEKLRLSVFVRNLSLLIKEYLEHYKLYKMN